MRNLLAFLAAALLLFLGAGWFLDWYKIQGDSTPEGHHHVNIDINGPKIGEDLRKGKQKLQRVLDGAKDESGKPTEDGKHEGGKKEPANP
jgi:hypothetical protein